MDRKNLLIISTVGLTYDGITQVILSYLKGMDRTGLSIYVGSTIRCDDSIREDIESLGCKIIDLPNRKTETKRYSAALLKAIRKNKIDILHVHGNSGTMAIEMLLGFFGGCKKRISHCHSTQTENPRADKMLRPVLYALSTHKIACGNASGKWLYNNLDFIVLRNGRNCDDYVFNPDKRKEIREKNGWDGKLVVGHVGNFLPVKNHEFIIDVFRILSKNNRNAELVLVGDGPLCQSILNATADIQDKVHFLGTVKNMPDVLQAMDVMMLPSLYEGVPLVVLEWQLSGLPCLVSDKVDTECAVTGLVKFLPISDPDVWVTEIGNCEYSNRRKLSDNSVEMLKRAGFDINTNASRLREIYFQ